MYRFNAKRFPDTPDSYKKTVYDFADKINNLRMKVIFIYVEYTAPTQFWLGTQDTDFFTNPDRSS